MRRSSIIVLASAVILLLAASAGVLTSGDRRAPRLSESVVRSIVERGGRAMADRDVDGVMALFVSNARIAEKTPDQIRSILRRTMTELVNQHLDVKIVKITMKSIRGVPCADVDLEIGEELPMSHVVYYKPKFTLFLETVKSDSALGLIHREEWRIRRMDTDISLDFPPFM